MSGSGVSSITSPVGVFKNSSSSSAVISSKLGGKFSESPIYLLASSRYFACKLGSGSPAANSASCTAKVPP